MTRDAKVERKLTHSLMFLTNNTNFKLKCRYIHMVVSLLSFGIKSFHSETSRWTRRVEIHFDIRYKAADNSLGELRSRSPFYTEPYQDEKSRSDAACPTDWVRVGKMIAKCPVGAKCDPRPIVMQGRRSSFRPTPFTCRCPQNGHIPQLHASVKSQSSQHNSRIEVLHSFPYRFASL